jgi:hypothetical protein
VIVKVVYTFALNILLPTIESHFCMSKGKRHIKHQGFCIFEQGGVALLARDVSTIASFYTSFSAAGAAYIFIYYVISAK